MLTLMMCCIVSWSNIGTLSKCDMYSYLHPHLVDVVVTVVTMVTVISLCMLKKLLLD